MWISGKESRVEVLKILAEDVDQRSEEMIGLDKYIARDEPHVKVEMLMRR